MLTQESRPRKPSRLRRARVTREAQHRVDEYVRQARAEGASWQQVGSALGITRQSAWERFRHLGTGRTTDGIPDGVMLNRHQQPHFFADWVINAATGDEIIQRWLEEPDIDLGLMAGFDRPVRPKELLGRSILRDFLMAKGHNNVNSNSVPDRSSCLICGREFLNEHFLQFHRKRDHKKSTTKPL